MNRICPSCQQQVDVQAAACPHCGYAAAHQTVSMCRSVVRPRQRRLPVCVHAAAQIDRTGSSVAFERGIHLGLELYLNGLVTHVTEVQGWLGSHGDQDYDEHHVMHVEEGTPDELLRECKSIVFDGGGDGPEHHLDGIDTMVQQVPWSHDALTRKTMVCFVNDQTKPARSGMTPQQIGSQIKSLGILFYLVCESSPELEALASAADGLVMPISNDPDVEQLKQATAMVSRSLTATIATGGTVPMVVN